MLVNIFSNLFLRQILQGQRLDAEKSVSLFLIMEYESLKKLLINLYKEYNNENFDEIDYVLSEISHKSLLEIKFVNFSKVEVDKAKKIVKKHLKTQKPYQKIFKRAYFYGLEFYVNANVLTPRQDSEILVENVLKNDFNSLLDICCGSGCLGLSIKNRKPSIDCLLSDISPKALVVAKKNAKDLKLSARFRKSDMFDKIQEEFDIIVCNPPYIETDTIKLLSKEVKDFDPQISLDGGKDGLNFYKILYTELEKHLTEHGKAFLEIGHNQGFLKDYFNEKYKVTLLKDYNNLDRLLILEREK